MLIWINVSMLEILFWVLGFILYYFHFPRWQHQNHNLNRDNIGSLSLLGSCPIQKLSCQDKNCTPFPGDKTTVQYTYTTFHANILLWIQQWIQMDYGRFVLKLWATAKEQRCFFTRYLIFTSHISQGEMKDEKCTSLASVHDRDRGNSFPMK